MNLLKFIFAIFAIVLLIYLILPGPSSINQFPPLPNSVKSELSGDTWQVPNVAAYFSNNYRGFVTNFYRQSLLDNSNLPFRPFQLNYPPEHAYVAIKDQTQSTFLEESYYPLRESLFVNGLEPFYEEDHAPKYWGATPMYDNDGQFFDNKTTLRYYSSPLWARLVVWLGVVGSIWGLWVVGQRVRRYG